MIKKLCKNKKGSFFDIFIIIAFIFGFITITIFGIMLYDKINTELEANGIRNATNETILAMEKTEQTIFMFDYLIIFLLGGLIIATIIGAFMIDSHPIFFVVAVLLLVLAIFGAYIYWSSYSQMLDASEDFSESSSRLTIMPKIMDNLPFITLIVGAIVIVVMVAKMRSGT